MLDYLKNRLNPIRNVDPKQLNAMLCAIDNQFGEKWLKSGNGNPVRLLWCRKDPLATNELFLLGDAILRGQEVNQKWVQEKVRIIKSGDSNNRQGALFELLALSMFTRQGVKIIPAPKDNPGYDVTVILPSERNIRISLKKYGLSAHYSSLKKKCAEVENHIITKLKERAVNAAVITVFTNKYLNGQDWTALEKELATIIEKFATSRRLTTTKSDNYELSINHLAERKHPFSTEYLSYVVRFFSPYHQNENKNLLDKVEDAFVNFENNAGLPQPECRGLVFIRIPETASLNLCKSWADEYFRNSEKLGLDAAIIYQASVVTTTESKSGIQHSIALAKRPEFDEWCQQRSADAPAISLQVLVGNCSSEPACLSIGDGENNIPLGERYVYQSGCRVVNVTFDKNVGSITTIRNLGPGITCHAVIEVPGGKLPLQGNFPPTNDLLLL